jgi:glutamate racemase
MYPHTKLKAFSCDGLAGAIERGVEGEAFDPADYLPKGFPDTVALGCTHYVWIKDFVENFYACRAVDGNAAIARRLQSVLKENVVEIGTVDHHGEKLRFFCPFLSPTTKKAVQWQVFREKNERKKRFRVKRAYAVYFLGKSGIGNSVFYKRMFAFSKKIVKMGKNPKKSRKNGKIFP